MHVQLRKVEHIADEPLEAFCLEADHFERVRPRLLVLDDALEQGLDMTADRGQRRPQLVRDGHQEVALERLGFLKLRCHLPEA